MHRPKPQRIVCLATLSVYTVASLLCQWLSAILQMVSIFKCGSSINFMFVNQDVQYFDRVVDDILH